MLDSFSQCCFTKCRLVINYQFKTYNGHISLFRYVYMGRKTTHSRVVYS